VVFKDGLLVEGDVVGNKVGSIVGLADGIFVIR
jgi:hypothetical protein